MITKGLQKRVDDALHKKVSFCLVANSTPFPPFFLYSTSNLLRRILHACDYQVFLTSQCGTYNYSRQKKYEISYERYK